MTCHRRYRFPHALASDATVARRWAVVLVGLAFLLLPADLRAQDSPDGLAVAVAMEQSVIAAIDRAAPAVVAIARVPKEGAVNVVESFQFNVPTPEQAAENPDDPDFIPAHYASGVILSPDGLILTCYHVLDDPELHDYYVYWKGRHAKASAVRSLAKVKAGDPWTDLAILKIDGEDLPTMPLGDASTLRRGSFVVSLGNPYATARDGEPSASWGIVSNLQRTPRPRLPQTRSQTPEAKQSLAEFGLLLQTDAKLNLGSSGGALVNLKGEMVGLTTSLAAVAGFEQPAGYAIPIDQPMRQVIQTLREGRQPAFGFLGIEPADTLEGRGARVARVVPGLPGDQAGLRAGDVIFSVAGVRTDGALELFRELSRWPAESEVEIFVAHHFVGAVQPERIKVTLGKKQLSLSKPAYSEIPEPTWRGMRVDWATALPPSQLLYSRQGSRADLAILRVDPDTPTWRAGLRPGQFLQTINGKVVSKPDAFYEQAEAIDGEVTLEGIGNDGRPFRAIVGQKD